MPVELYTCSLVTSGVIAGCIMVTVDVTDWVFGSSSRTGKNGERSDRTMENRISTDTISVIGGIA